jgi:hypothetical protein
VAKQYEVAKNRSASQGFSRTAFAGKAVNRKGEEVKIMTYNKPTVEVLGDAVAVIQSSKSFSTGDGGNPDHIVPPAYELDE